MGKYIRHSAAILVGALLTFLMNTVPGFDTIIPPEDLPGVQDALIGTVTFIGTMIWFFGYAWSEKFLKRFRRLDPEGASDRELLKTRVGRGA
jgi:hypothetical protein